jgi:hypothetical protein
MLLNIEEYGHRRADKSIQFAVLSIESLLCPMAGFLYC